MRAFGVLGANPVSKAGRRGVLLPGLLVAHAVLSASMVIGGRSGFERMVGTTEAGYGVGVVVAACGAAGVWLQLSRAPVLSDRLACAAGGVLPLVWLWAAWLRADYDAITAIFSSTSWGEQGESWFAGVPVAAMAYTFVLFMYTRACVRAWDWVNARYRPSIQWLAWALCVVGFAGVVHWATGF